MSRLDRAVSDAGPLIHLAEIGKFRILELFFKIYIPEGVYKEVCIENMPGSREVRNAKNIEVVAIHEEELKRIKDKISLKLDKGELEALALCERLGVDIFLTDDLDARDAGRQLGFEVHGSVGVIARDYKEGLIDFDDAKKALEELYTVSKLFITKAIIEEAANELEKYKHKTQIQKK